ncbi:LysR family transcriptional regulator [Vibrio vulnificus]|nr:LysR family transcriptional regulator [Vibrio vulnificus]ELQ2524478.1 LysR family transcriptional regulator [Vibrio vulnificus]
MNNLNNLHVFLLLMQTRSTQRCAKKLGRSQSYVSKVLAQLRDELADPLFLRESTGLVPTDYANVIEPKIRIALEQIDSALVPQQFDPSLLDKATLHIVEPYLIQIGKALIEAIRSETKAKIEIRQWGEHSESLILNESVDIGLHIINDKPQAFYQKRIHSGAGYFEGNKEGEYVKFIVSGVNEYSDHFKTLEPETNVGIIVDSHALMMQLMEDCYTLRYEPHFSSTKQTRLNIDVALITKASLRHAAKQKWLTDLIISVVEHNIKTRWSNKHHA